MGQESLNKGFKVGVTGNWGINCHGWFSQLSLTGVKTQGDKAFLFTFSIDEGFKIFIPGAWIWEHLAHPVEVVVGNHAVFSISCHIKELWRRREVG